MLFNVKSACYIVLLCINDQCNQISKICSTKKKNETSLKQNFKNRNSGRCSITPNLNFQKVFTVLLKINYLCLNFDSN